MSPRSPVRSRQRLRSASRTLALVGVLLVCTVVAPWTDGIGGGADEVGAAPSPYPYVERALLTQPTTNIAAVSMALSADGSTAVVGYQKVVSIYGVSGTTYRQIGPTLTEPSGPDPNDSFGESVAISSDGSTVAVGNSFNGSASRTGAVYVYTRSGNAYVELGGAPAALGDATYVTFGYKVALSGDGATLLIVATDVTSGQPIALIYTRSGGVYTRQQVIPAGPYPNGRVSTRFALSTDGGTLAIGFDGMGTFTPGSVLVYIRSGGTFTQFGGPLAASDGPGGANFFGNRIALSGDGTTLAITAEKSATYPQNHVAYVFAKGITSYSQVQEVTVGPTTTGFGADGVALNGDGTILATGVMYDTPETTALTPTIHVHRKSGGTYSLFGNGLIAITPGLSPYPSGRLLALSGDGATLLAGSGNTDSVALFTESSIAGVGVWRGGNWNLANTLTNTPNADIAFAYAFGQANSPVLCDWSGTGAKQPGFFSASSDGWFIGGGLRYQIAFGQPGDIPVCGDWTGQGKQTVGVFRSGVFYLLNSNASSATADIVVGFGQAGDIPVVGDWTGQGKQTVGIYRNGVFYLLNNNVSAAAADIVVGFGQAGDVPVVGDWTGGGIESIGVFRNGAWYLRNTNTTGAADIFFLFGTTGDTPLVRSERANGVAGPGAQPRVAPTATAVKGTATPTRNAATATPGKGTATPNPIPPSR